MKPYQKMVDENGVEIPLYPDPVLCYNEHTDYCAIDFNGRAGNFYAPCELKVVRNNNPTYHEVWFWTTKPVHTRRGIMHLTFTCIHDNDVSDLTVGKIIPQGQKWYQEGGWGANGSTTYPAHIHMACAIGHTLSKVQNANGKWDLVNCVYANEVLYLAGNEDIQRLGNLEWEVYRQKEVGASSIISLLSIDTNSHVGLIGSSEIVCDQAVDTQGVVGMIGELSITDRGSIVVRASKDSERLLPSWIEFVVTIIKMLFKLLFGKG